MLCWPIMIPSLRKQPLRVKAVWVLLEPLDQTRQLGQLILGRELVPRRAEYLPFKDQNGQYH